jgi:hypothetical protein
MTAQQATDLTSISTFIGTLMNDPDAATARATLGVGDATETAAGIIEIATNAEAQAGTDAVRAMTPASAAAARGVYRGASFITSNRPLTEEDCGKYLTTDSALEYTLTTPPSTDTTFPINGRIDMWVYPNKPNNKFTIVAGSGATVLSKGGNLSIGPGDAATLIRASASQWHLIGGLSA